MLLRENTWSGLGFHGCFQSNENPGSSYKVDFLEGIAHIFEVSHFLGLPGKSVIETKWQSLVFQAKSFLQGMISEATENLT